MLANQHSFGAPVSSNYL